VGESITSESGVRPFGAAKITSTEAGYNEFLLWTPGLTPGEWSPTSKGPGLLSGNNTANTPLGRGRGYYQAGDNHEPEGGGYPELPHTDWNKPLPRFLYNSKFSVRPAVKNFEDGVFTDSTGRTLTEQEVLDLLSKNQIVEFTEIQPDLSAVGNTDINNTRVRPEEIFVACFWTEPHRYKRQLVAWDYKNPDARGVPQPIYADYDGTVVRVKYIRLDELPRNAVTQRLIPDTGWAGKSWANTKTDTVDFDDPSTAEDIWQKFSTTPVRAGSTGSQQESVTELVIDPNSSTRSV
jgi:hypothetical protein